MNDSNIYEKIYEVVSDIPVGKVVSYGQVAWMAGHPGAHRVVGYAMSRVPGGLELPCHRVVNKAGEMAPFHVFGGEGFQRHLLEQEGVTFLKNGRIDMKKCQWNIFESEENF